MAIAEPWLTSVKGAISKIEVPPEKSSVEELKEELGAQKASPDKRKKIQPGVIRKTE
jgi:hypothetical protein